MSYTSIESISIVAHQAPIMTPVACRNIACWCRIECLIILSLSNVEGLVLQVLYVGDHIYGDILRSKKELGMS
jgi:hypothetical protein